MKRTPMKAVLLCLAVVAVIAACAAPASAITWGVPDEDPAHPNVGMVIVEYPDGVIEPVASGTLIAPKVFLTAGHVWDYIASNSLEEHFWVSFASTFDPASNRLTGRITPHPDYRWGAADKCDLAVIELTEPQWGITPAKLPTARLLNVLAARNTLRGQTFTCVGYGLQERLHMQSGAPAFYGGGTRMKAVSTFSTLTKPWLHTSQNQAHEEGGTCYGDSGGPYFLDRAGYLNTIVAVTSWGDAVCVAHSISYRVDTPSARGFLDDYVALP
jgi:hypothetical protein